mmetsp:Transcript_37230/g.86838  ORF Transcript_37230/g.86838 Transcript_37230/m.86838 type:complete len:90 (+) Transcript_37230:528-797(+)
MRSQNAELNPNGGAGRRHHGALKEITTTVTPLFVGGMGRRQNMGLQERKFAVDLRFLEKREGGDGATVGSMAKKDPLQRRRRCVQEVES